MKNLPKEVDCKRAGAALNRLLPVSFEYAHRKRLDRHLFSRYAEFGDFWERCPENWEEHARGMLAAGAVFGRPKSAAAFVRSAGSQLRQQLDGMIAGMGSGSGKSGESPGVALSKRYGLPPRAIHELMRPALPAVRDELNTSTSSRVPSSKRPPLTASPSGSSTSRAPGAVSRRPRPGMSPPM